MKSQSFFTTLVFILFSISLGPMDLNGQRAYPKLINFFLTWDGYHPTSQEAVELSKWDIVVLDMENAHLRTDQLQIMRAANPKIKLLAYISFPEILNEIPQYGILRNNLKAGIHPAWYLRNAQGENISFWVGAKMLNISSVCPTANNQKWNSYIANFIKTKVLSNPIWDGVFLDNCWDGAGPVDDLFPDIDGSGRSIWDKNWRDLQIITGTREAISIIRQGFPSALILTNSGFSYTYQTNGGLIEKFPVNETSWEHGISDYLNSQRNANAPAISSINCFNYNQFDLQLMRFGLTSTLLGNGYYSFDYGDTNHGQIWWYDEYSFNLGNPLNNAIPVNEQQSAELLQNTSFESGMNSWIVDPGTQYGSAVIDNTNYRSGRYSLKCTPQNPPEYWQFTVKQIGIPIYKDSLYKMSFWAKSTEKRIITVSIIQDKADWEPFFDYIYYIELGTEWKYYEYYFLTSKWPKNETQNNTTNTRFSFNLGWENSPVWIDDVSLKKCSHTYWQREFDNGFVFCNPTNKTVNIQLPRSIYNLKGLQAPNINTGLAVNSISIPPKDGIILSKKDESLDLEKTEYNNYYLISPNIGNGKVYLSHNKSNINTFNTVVYNAEGKVVFRGILNSDTGMIDFSESPNGIYIIKINGINHKYIKI